MAFELPALPYDHDALAPFLSADTLRTHHGKHHQAYINKLNAAIEGTPYAGKSIEEVIRLALANGETAVFDNAAQTFNHTFLWHSMAPKGDSAPSAELASAIDDAFGSLDGFLKAFKQAATTQFGSGWAWLVQDDSGLAIVKTGNADTPVAHGQRPLLTLDVWEHAYYLDYKNDRGAYVDVFLDGYVNWAFANDNFAAEQAAA
ncbi:MAG: superoxide dismutase [Woeseiaceae bacterium]|nr:superoxide dismutase [Woeseiaceae bacterium]